MAVHVENIVILAKQQDGDRYVFGGEARHDESDPAVFDCSELIEWVCARLGVNPRVPDGSWNQAKHCKKHDTLIPVEKGVDTAGSLLFRFSSNPFVTKRPSEAHVAMSLGDGRTMEARSTALGVGIFPKAADRGWTHAGLIPGAEYGAPPVAGHAITEPVVIWDDEPDLQYVGVWQAVTAAGVVNGKEPRRPMTRQELAAVLSRKVQIRGLLGID
jgi:cell wall-associated NlpC family hydrolase